MDPRDSCTSKGSCRHNIARGVVMRIYAISVLTSVALIAFAASSAAHHTIAVAYDIHHSVTLQGTVAEVRWQRPHVFLYLDVREEDGHFVRWDVETQAPQVLRRQG